jgi:thiol:disulfide interchange protein DsbD
MGFFAGILSTPCSGALLGFVLVWAQTQPLLVSSTAIVLMGVGMALPYAVIVLVPSLLQRLPKPGPWMEVFKKSAGFLLFFIAVKLTLAALPKEQLLNVLTYGIIFAFCVWMWGKWVDFATPATKRWAVRAGAATVALGAGLWLLPVPKPSAQAAINWRPYDAPLVQQAVSENRPVLLKFTADWCTNCKIVERRIYGDPEVARLIREKDVLPVKADTTLIDYPATRDFKELYGEAGNVPVSILVLPDGSREKLRGIFDKELLVRILEKLPEARVNGREEKLQQSAQDG